ncbi:MAG: glycosyltransferase family 4 protein [Candidatus Andeanibacterium colombiense]|uniref:Glycosyltransferase family 4 protein n=1 Tax=Candidatus Andeanibacterium colombiense TaxID=3121345 RepID=A0AAJ5X7I1_9SPHN|nr:MAG: glycosyltransferase family 4 protein [Sphingomonadaceae bacterium]
MKLAYPMLWSGPLHKADRDQAVSTAAAFARRGHEVTLLLPRLAGDGVVDSAMLRDYFDVTGDFRTVQVPVRWAGTPALPSLWWLRRVLKSQLVTDADVLFSRIPAMLAVGERSPVPFVTDHYRPWPDDLPMLRPLIRRTARQRHCLGILTHSDFAAESYRRCGVSDDKLLVAHNGAELGRFEPALTPAEARRMVGLDPDRPTVVYAGRINEKKGLDQVLALAGLRPEVAFVLVGSESEGPIERAAREHPNLQVFPWQGPRTLAPFLFAADVLVVPPSSAPLEQFGNCVLPIKLFAYFAAGRPILAPEAADTVGFLRQRENALLVMPDDPQAAASALDELLGDRALAARLGEAARSEALLLSWDRRAEKIETFLLERLASAGLAPKAAST